MVQILEKSLPKGAKTETSDPKKTAFNPGIRKLKLAKRECREQKANAGSKKQMPGAKSLKPIKRRLELPAFAEF